MSTVIGPTFAEELRQAGVSDFRFTWNPLGVIHYHPDFPVEERERVEAVLKAHDGPLSEARHQAVTATNAEAGGRIAAMFGKPPDTPALYYKEINALARAVEILDKKIEGTALPEERLDLEVLRGIYGRAQAIRDAEDKAQAVLRGAKSVEEVQDVTPAWPEE